MMTQTTTVRSHRRRNRPLPQVVKIEHLGLDKIHIGKVLVRKHSDKGITALAQSITEFGFNVPVLIDNGNELISGHGRVQAVEALGEGPAKADNALLSQLSKK